MLPPSSGMTWGVLRGKWLFRGRRWIRPRGLANDVGWGKETESLSGHLSGRLGQKRRRARKTGSNNKKFCSWKQLPASVHLGCEWEASMTCWGRSNLPCACDWCHLTRSGPSVHDGTVFVRGRLIKITSNFVNAALTLKLRTYRSLTITNQRRAQFYSPAVTRHRGTHLIMAT